MIAVQTIRAKTRAPTESAMSAWQWTSYKAMARPIETAATALLSHNKRKRDCFEAYDFQVHRRQKMRYSSLLREPPMHPSSLYPRTSLEQLADNAVVSKYPVSTQVSYQNRDSTYRRPAKATDNILETRRRSKKSKKSSSSSSSRGRVRMTKKHYNKKKRLEMMEATDRHIRRILESSRESLSLETREKIHFVRRKAEQLDFSLRDQCNSIVQKERDIKSWLGMTTSSKSKIVSLRKRLHDRWAEVKDLQSAVKPRRQRLKNLRYAAMCVERSIAEE